MQIFLIRHGQTYNNVKEKQVSNENYHQNKQADTQLTDIGLQQANQLGNYLIQKGIHLSEIHVSPMHRAIHTGLVLKQFYLDAHFKVYKNIFEYGGLHDNSNQIIVGKNRSAFISSFKDLENNYRNIKINSENFDYNQIEIDNQIQDEGWYDLDHIETYDEVYERARKVVNEMIELGTDKEKEGKVVAFVCHGYFINAILRIVTDANLSSSFRFQSSNCGVTKLSVDNVNRKVNLVNFNITEHLTPETYKMATQGSYVKYEQDLDISRENQIKASKCI